MISNNHGWRAICFAIAVLSPVLTLAGTATHAQTSSDTVGQVLGNRRPLPLPTDPYERSQADQRYNEQLRDQSLQSQSQAAQSQQQLIDQSGRQLQQRFQTQQQSDTLSQQQIQLISLAGIANAACEPALRPTGLRGCLPSRLASSLDGGLMQLSPTPGRPRGMLEPKPLAFEPDAMAKRETLELARAYYRITSAYVFELVRSLAKAGAPASGQQLDPWRW